jgi:5-methylcytosine-specific restriction endonuclease McrA
MPRQIYDSRKYYSTRAALPKPDGMKCIICGSKFEKPNRGRYYCSRDCFSKWYGSLQVDSWERVRNTVLRRDKRCMECGTEMNDRFEVHHIKPISEGGAEFDPDNCISLCYRCHKDRHSTIGIKKRKNRSLKEFIEA